MKSIFRHYIITLFSLWATDRMIPGIRFNGGFELLLITAATLMALNIFIKPILKIIFLPITVITLGLSLIVVNALIFFAVDYYIQELTVSAWKFDGLMLAGYSIPAIEFGIIPTYMLGAFVLSALIAFMRWL